MYRVAGIPEAHRQRHHRSHRDRDDHRQDYLKCCASGACRSISINTDKGEFGTRQDFVDSLNVIRAESYAGKSQLVQSIMYALGMEGMQGTSHAVPLAHAMTDYPDYKVNGQEAKAKVIRWCPSKSRTGKASS